MCYNIFTTLGTDLRLAVYGIVYVRVQNVGRYYEKAMHISKASTSRTVRIVHHSVLYVYTV